MTLHLRRLNGTTVEAMLSFPDEVAALVLKTCATRVRFKDTDIVDIWRCLEICNTAAVGPESFDAGEPAEAATIVRKLFTNRRGQAMESLIAEQGLSGRAADERFTRLCALVARVLGPE